MSTIVLVAFNGNNGAGPPGIPQGVNALGSLAGDKVLQVTCIAPGTAPGFHVGTQSATLFGSVIPENDLIVQNYTPADLSTVAFLAVLSRG